jgi:hypothetical protein
MISYNEFGKIKEDDLLNRISALYKKKENELFF